MSASAEQPADQAPPKPSVSTTPAQPDHSLSTRCIGLAYAILFGCLAALFSSRVNMLNLGATSSGTMGVLRLLSFLIPAYPGFLGLLALASGQRPARSLNPLGIPFEAWWYTTLATLTWREVKRFFLHPVAYIALFVFVMINGAIFAALLNYYAGPHSFQTDYQEPASYWVISNQFLWFSLLMICPAITMRLLAEEQRSKTLEMLLTAPVTDIQVVLSKFLSAATYLLFMIAFTAGYLVILRQFAPEWDWGPVFGGYLGLFLTGCLFLSIGTFTSSITQSQIIAYLLAVLPLFAMILLTGLGEVLFWESLRPAMAHMNVLKIQNSMALGVVEWKGLVFYLSSIVFVLFLAVRGVESHRWR